MRFQLFLPVPISVVWRAERLVVTDPTQADFNPPGSGDFWEGWNQSPGVFLDFAELPLTKPAVLQFAREYGSAGETLADWQQLQSELAGALKRIAKATANPLTGFPAQQLGVVAEWVDKQLVINATASNLAAMLWLQVAHWVDGGFALLKCPACQRHFAPARDDQRYCSPACRVARHRQLKREAVERHELGESAAALAQAMDVELATITRWLQGAG